MARTIRDSKVPDGKLLRPFDVAKFGGEDDPCFGKLYSLSAEECMVCGDHELCAIVFANKAHGKRIVAEKKNQNLDLEIDSLELQKDIKDLNKKLVGKGFGRVLRFRRLRQRFRIDDSQIKIILNGCKGLPK